MEFYAGRRNPELPMPPTACEDPFAFHKHDAVDLTIGVKIQDKELGSTTIGNALKGQVKALTSHHIGTDPVLVFFQEVCQLLRSDPGDGAIDVRSHLPGISIIAMQDAIGDERFFKRGKYGEERPSAHFLLRRHKIGSVWQSLGRW
jgi:hypothetical protein